MVPKDVHVLGFGTCQCYLYDKRDLGDMVKLRIDLNYVGRT